MSASFVVGPSAGHKHTHTVILLHGRDSQAEEFASEFFECEASGPETQTDRTLPALFPSVRWVFPQAASLRSERFSVEMSQWFDMWSVDNAEERAEMQVPGLLSSVASIRGLVNQEERLVPRANIFLGGISQGFATAMATVFAEGSAGFAGLCGFSSWLPLADKAELNEAALDQQEHMQRLYTTRDGEQQQEDGPSWTRLLPTPVLLEHCRDDEVVPIRNGARLRDVLGRLAAFDVEWHEYEDGGHWINEPQGVDDFVCFLQGNWHRDTWVVVDAS